MNIIIGGAWPYANGSLHIGHIAGLLPGDVLARYFRLKGDTVMYVSGSDCHGTPVTIRARQENKSSEEISDYYHEEFIDCFKRLLFSYDLYGKTSSLEHQDFVWEYHRKLYEGDYVYESQTLNAYCENCSQFLPDRFVIGTCPLCGKKARGDQCEECGKVLDPENLLDPKCSICSTHPVFKVSDHLFLAVSKLKDELGNYIESHKSWRKNAYELSKRYLTEGLLDRCLTRDLHWGIDVPKKGYENKKIYIWAENVLGYLSCCNTLCRNYGLDFLEFWNSSKQYYVHGKDNIPFHTIILPSLLLARKDVKLKLPDEIISNEYLTLEGRKISTSGNWALWIKDLLEKYDSDSIRYFLITNGPEKRDTDFSLREFINSHNGELLGAYGNFVNRTFVFIKRFFNNKIPFGEYQKDIKASLLDLYISTGKMIERGSLKEAIDLIFSFIRKSNKFYDEEKPWITIKEDYDRCSSSILTCTLIIANLSTLLAPFLPSSSEKVKATLNIKDSSWNYTDVLPGTELSSFGLLFERL